MTQARDLADLAGAATAGTITGRNLIINGAMTVAQRGTTHTQSPNSGNYHTVDRYSYRRTGTWSGVTAVVLSQQSSGAPSGFTHFLRYAPTGSDSSTPSDTSMYIDAKLEGNSVSSLALGTSAAKSFTISFYVRSSVTGTFCVSFQNNDSTEYSYLAEYTINSANTWEQKEITVDAPTSGTFPTDTSTGLAIYFIVSADSSSSTYSTSTVGSWLASTDARWSSNQSDGVTKTANQTFDITGVQLEVGETATPFEHRSFGEELARCQRYCFTQAGFTRGDVAIGDADVGTTRLYSALSINTSGSIVFFNYPTTLRKVPDLSYTTAGGGVVSNDYSSTDRLAIRDSDDINWYIHSFKAEAEL